MCVCVLLPKIHLKHITHSSVCGMCLWPINLWINDNQNDYVETMHVSEHTETSEKKNIVISTCANGNYSIQLDLDDVEMPPFANT